MSHFPLFVELAGQRCLILGGGQVAWRRCLVLRDFGAQVVLLAPELCPDLARRLAEDDGISWIRFALQAGDEGLLADWLADVRLAIAASDDSAMNHLLAAVAKDRQIPVSIADDPAASTFLFPATVHRGNLCAGITSGGSSPHLVQHLRLALEAAWPGWLTELAGQLQHLRQITLARPGLSAKDRQTLLDGLVLLALAQQSPLDPGQIEAYITRLGQTGPASPQKGPSDD